MKPRIGIFFVFIAFAQVVFGQDHACQKSISGFVKDENSGETIPFATLQLKSPQFTRSAISKENGAFSFEKLCKGSHVLEVRFTGYKIYTKTIHLTDSDLAINISLETETTSLGEVLVEGEKAKEIVSLQEHSVSEAELAQSRGETLGQALRDITGVNTLQTGPTIAKPVIHGLHSNRILILNNGIRQEGQRWGQEHAPEIDPFVATNLSLIKGAAAVKYGSDAIGGVILVNPPDLPGQAGIHGGINLVRASNNGLYASSGLIEGGVKGLGGFGWRLQGTYKKAGDARAADYRLTNTGVREFNYSLGIGYHRDGLGAEIFFSSFDTKIGILRSAHIGNLTDLQNAIGSARPLYIDDFSYNIDQPKQEVKHQLLKANFHWDIETLGDFKVLYGFQKNQRKEFDIRRGNRSGIAALSLELATHTVDLDLDLLPIGRWKGDVGVSLMYQLNENVPGTGIRPLIPDFENFTVGGHLIERYVREKYELEFGVRYDFKHYLVKKFDSNNELIKPKFDFNNITGSVGAVFYAGENLTFRTNLGTAWRAPHVNELYSEGLHHGSATIEEGDPHLKSEKAIKWINNINLIGSKVDLDISIYYNYIQDYIYLRPEDIALTIRGAFPVFRYRQTDASFVGLDMDFRYSFLPNVDWINKLSLIKAQDESTNSPLINIPANRLQSGVTYKIAKARHLKDIFFSLSAHVVDKQRNAPRVVTIEEIRTAQTSETSLFTEVRSVFDLLEPPAGYVNVDLTMGFHIPFKGLDMGFIFSMENALNNSYRDYMNRLRYYADDIGRNFSLKINCKF